MQTDTSILVLANGEQTRWPEGSSPKQLLEVDGVTLIRRMVDYFEQGLRAPVLVITQDRRIIDVVGGMRWLNLGATENQLATLLLARPFWGRKRTLCLLGDVYYSDAAIAAITACRKPVAFYGRRLASEVTGKPYGELVAMAWDADFDASMAWSLEHWRDRPLLWSPYRDAANLWDLPDGENYLFSVPPCLTEIDDETDDFDTPEDWVEWNRRRAERAAAPAQ